MSVRDDEPDPTGMRDLLRSMPDPGPMPDDLVARIHASLSDLGPLDVEPAAPVSAGVPRETSGPGRGSWLARHGGKLAVAAVLVVGGGVLVDDLLSMGAGAGDTASESTAGGSGEDQRSTATGQDRDTSGAVTAPGPVVVRLSERDYSSQTLAAQVGARLVGPEVDSPIGPLTAESPAIGPIGSELGVRSCLEALGLPRDTATEVDLARVDGMPAAVLVVTVEGERTAYAVGRDCTTGNPSLLAGPVPLP